jgi:U3 small nucleolar ribonucleoprotein component
MNNDLESLIKQRVLDELFDDRVRYTSSNALREHFGSAKDIAIDTEKSKKGLAELYEEEFKNYLGLG